MSAEHPKVEQVYDRCRYVDWIESSMQQVGRRLGDDVASLDLLDSFVSQYDSAAHRVGNDETLKSRLKSLVGRWRLRPNVEVPDLSMFQQKDLVVWPFQPSHVAVMSPVYKQLNERSNLVMALCHNPGAHGPVREKMWPAVLCSSGHIDYRNAPACQRAIAACEKIEPILHLGKEIRFQELLENSLAAWYGVYEYTVRLTQAIVEDIAPKGILVGNDLTLAGRVACRIARRNSIATFSIGHGAIDNTLYRHGCSSLFFLWGEEDRRRLISWGVDSSRLVVSGSPKHEEVTKSVSIVKMLEGTWNTKVLIATSGPGHKVSKNHHSLVVNCVTNIAKKFPDTLFVAKLHRKDRPDFYHDFVSLSNTQLVEYDSSDRNGNIMDWLSASDMLVTGGSTTAIDAMYVDIPVATLDLAGELADVSFIQAEATMHARSVEELVQHVKTVHAGKWENTSLHQAQTEYVSSRFARPNGGPTNTIVERIMSETGLA